MIQILKVTFALLLIFCIFAFIAGIVDNGFGVGLYFVILGSASLFFPVLIFVTLYHLFFRKKFNYKNFWLSFITKSLSLILISFLCLFVWAILEFIVTTGFDLDFKWILEDYKNEYLGYMPLVIILALLIPIGYQFLKSPVSKK